MTDPELARLETRLRAAAAALPYPPTPDVAASVRARLNRGARSAPLAPRRLAYVAIALALVLLASLAVPEVRATLVEFLQIGVVRIFPVAPTATPTATGAPTIAPSPTFLPSVLDFDGETTLAEARQQVPFPIRLPSYPGDLGPPDRVFVQFMDGTFLLLVWLDPNEPARVRLSLHIIENESFAVRKVEPTVIDTASVNDQLAYWTEGPYFVVMSNGNTDFTRLVSGHVLIWVEGSITYRLETDLPMDEAVKVAESLIVP